MQRVAELILRLLETQGGGSHPSPELIAEDKRLMDDLQNCYLAETCLEHPYLAEN